MKPVRIALLGTGAMAEYQRKKFAVSDAEVVACFDADAHKAERFAREQALTQYYSDLQKLLDEAPVDAVSCCLVDAGHFDAGIRVLDRGLALFGEKPLAQTLVGARELAARALSPNTVAMVNLSKRNAPALHALKADIEAGLLGDIVSVEARYHQGWVVTKVWGDWAVEPRWKWRLQSEFCTAGVVGDLGVHLMDALMLLLGTPHEFRLTCVRDLASAGLAQGVDTSLLVRRSQHPAYVDLSAELVFSGVPCQFSLSWTDDQSLDSFRIRVQGTRAAGVLDLERSRTAYRLLATDERDIVGPPVESTYERFVAAVRSAKSGTPGVTEALAAQEALERLLAGAV